MPFDSASAADNTVVVIQDELVAGAEGASECVILLDGHEPAAGAAAAAPAWPLPTPPAAATIHDEPAAGAEGAADGGTLLSDHEPAAGAACGAAPAQPLLAPPAAAAERGPLAVEGQPSVRRALSLMRASPKMRARPPKRYPQVGDGGHRGLCPHSDAPREAPLPLRWLEVQELRARGSTLPRERARRVLLSHCRQMWVRGEAMLQQEALLEALRLQREDPRL